VGSDPVTDADGADTSAWATVALRACAMPPEEIRAVLGAKDPETVRRHIELHVERLEERMVRQRAILDRVHRQLSESRQAIRSEMHASAR